jgi:uncharacterized protein with von Willebrand factor type A (vWA) domain
MSAAATKKAAAAKAANQVVDELKNGRDATIGVPKWDRYVAAGEAAGGGSFHDALAAHPGAAWSGFAREVFSKLYGSVAEKALAPEERPEGSEWVEKLHDTASSLPEWRALTERAKRDAWACGVAAGEALKVLAQQVTPPAEDPQKIADELDFVKSLMESGKTTPQHLRRMAALQKQLQTAKQGVGAATKMLATRQASIRSAMRGGAQKAQQAIDEMDAAMSGLSAGDGTGVASRTTLPPAQLRKQLLENPKLRRVAALAGRMKSAAIYKQRTKAKVGQEEICDVTQGSNLSRLLPVELGALANENTEALLYRRMMEGSCLQYDLRGKVKQAEGPIILAVDESGSMQGAPDEWAKAVMFGLLEIAARQNRPAYLVHFDGRVTRTDSFPDARKLDLATIAEAVSYFTGGGTSIASALKKCADVMLESEGPWKRADVILVTDGEDYDASQSAQIKRIKDRGGHLYTVCIGCEPGGILKEESDEVVHLHSQDIKNGDTSKISAVFSI